MTITSPLSTNCGFTAWLSFNKSACMQVHIISPSFHFLHCLSLSGVTGDWSFSQSAFGKGQVTPPWGHSIMLETDDNKLFMHLQAYSTTQAKTTVTNGIKNWAEMTEFFDSSSKQQASHREQLDSRQSWWADTSLMHYPTYGHCEPPLLKLGVFQTFSY